MSIGKVNHRLPLASTDIYADQSRIVDMNVGERLRKLREDHGLTLEQAGKIAGTTKQSASQIEKGITKAPGGIFLYRWSRHYGVDLEWLIAGKGEKKPASQLARPDPEIVRATFELLRGSYADQGKVYDIEAEPDLFATVYERLAKLAGKPRHAELVSIGRTIQERQQGVADDGKERTERTHQTHPGKGKKRAAG